MEKRTKIIIIAGAVVVILAALAAYYFVFFTPNTKYKEAISIADNYFADEKYTDAKTSYTYASEVKPNEEYPKQKLSEINSILDAAKKQVKYDETIAEADKLYNSAEFEAALNAYIDAADIKSGEQYPKDKIEELNGILEQLRLKALSATYKYHVIIGSYMEPSNATRMNKKLMDQGKESRIIVINEGRMQAVTLDSYPSLQEAVKALPGAKEFVAEDEPWVLIREL